LDPKDTLKAHLEQSAEVKRASIESLATPFAEAARLIGDRLDAGGTLYTCGNGGSMCDAMHLVGEMIGRFAYDRGAIKAVTLGANPASATAIGNDYSYKDILLREADALIEPGDAVIGISTSGDAENVRAVADLARSRGAFVLGLTGKSGGALAQACDVELRVPSDSTPRIQEVHITLIHALCDLLERRLRPR
jgi:D-sedoheptulose 7-phosphate isomerase